MVLMMLCQVQQSGHLVHLVLYLLVLTSSGLKVLTQHSCGDCTGLLEAAVYEDPRVSENKTICCHV
jgi:hypothetical protein